MLTECECGKTQEFYDKNELKIAPQFIRIDGKSFFKCGSVDDVVKLKFTVIIQTYCHPLCVYACEYCEKLSMSNSAKT